MSQIKRITLFLLGPASTNETITDHHGQTTEAAEKMITVLNDEKIILGPIGRTPVRSHTQSKITAIIGTYEV